MMAARIPLEAGWARRNSMRAAARAVLVIIVCTTIVMGALGGCAGKSAAAGGGDSYLERYNRGEYAAAKFEAEKQMASSTGAARDQAALIAGLSSQALGQNLDAKKYLRPLTGNRDSAIAGRAGAALGLLARSEGNHDNAARLLAEASRKLTGDEAARAAMFAGDEYKKLGQVEKAKAQYAEARKLVQSEALRLDIDSRAGATKYTIQVGAYTSRANAEKRARELQAKAAGLGLGSPMVIPTSAKGQALFAVQVGQFSQQQEAIAAMPKLNLNKNQAIVTALDAQY